MLGLIFTVLLSAAPADGPSSANPNVIPGKSAGKIEIGTARAAVRQHLGKPSEIEVVSGAEYEAFFPRGIEVRYEKGRVLEIFVHGSALAGYEQKGAWKPFDLRMAKGITFRSTYADVLAAYGPPVKSGENRSAPIPYKWLAYEGVTFDFESSTGMLAMLALPGFVSAPPRPR